MTEGRVRKGMKLVSNDKRTKGKTVEVLSVEIHYDKVSGWHNWYAIYQAGYRKASIRVDHIHDPGYEGASGWTIVTELPPASGVARPQGPAPAARAVGG